MDTHLFLFGGSPPFTKQLGKKFTKFAQKDQVKIAILFIERDGWQDYMPKYTSVLEANGTTNFVYLPLSPYPSPEIVRELETSTGIIISGGDTELYREYIVETTVGTTIKRLYDNGIPIAGFSAGALIAPEYCVVSPHDTLRKEQLFLKGLGLLEDYVLSVHYSTWNEEENLLKAINTTGVPKGFGIDEESGIYINNGRVVEIEGHLVFMQH
ncbi:Type 1 glutamine amidotransferase-like domain-containing protein [Fredinandcohnia humi]